MQIDQTRLKKGINTLFIDSPGSTAATVQIWFRAGSALEDKSNQGIAHFLEHMFFKGTKKRPGSAIAHEIESYGGEVNAFTSFDYTCYYINSPVNNLSHSVEILMDMVSNPLFDQNELVPERGVVYEEYRRAIDNSSQYNFMQIQKGCFTKGYKHPILGNEKTIKSFSKDQLKKFRKDNYNLENSILIVAGDLKHRSKIENIINKYNLPKGKSSNFPKFILKKNSLVDIHTKEVRQSVLTFCIQSPNYLDSKVAAEDLAINCFSFGDTCRLYKSIVTNSKLATAVSGSTMYFSNGGVHFLRVAFPEENINQVLKNYLDVIEDILKNPFEEQELLKIKNQYIASKVYEKESLEAFAFSLGHGFAQTGNIHCEEEFINKIKQTNINQVNQAFVDIFQRHLHTSMQIPQTNKNSKKYNAELEKFRKKLNSIASKYSEKHKAEHKITSSKFDPEVKQIEIKKGIKFIYRHNPLTPTFVLHAYLKGGLTNETPSTCGLSQALSRCLTYGYKGLDYDDLKRDLDIKSSYINGFSGRNAYGLTLHGQSEFYHELNDHFSNILLNPTIPEDYVTLEKELVSRALENQKEDPVKECFKTFNNLVFNKHPYSLDSIGTEESLKNITKESILELHNERLKNSEIVFTYCGDKDLDTVLSKVNKICENLEPRKSSKTKSNSIKPLKGQRVKKEFEREQTHIFIGLPAYKSGNKNDLYLKMLTSHLSGQSSELFVEVRDKRGLCYSVQPIHYTAIEAGSWGIYIGAGNDKAQDAIEAILNLLHKYRDKGFTKKEFNRVKKMIDGQNQINIQTNDDYAHFYSIPVLHGLGLDYQHNSFEEIRNFDYEDFNIFIEKFLSGNWNIVEVGP